MPCMQMQLPWIGNYLLQWNHSNSDTLGTISSVDLMEVLRFQGLVNMQNKCSIWDNNKCSKYGGVLILEIQISKVPLQFICSDKNCLCIRSKTVIVVFEALVMKSQKHYNERFLRQHYQLYATHTQTHTTSSRSRLVCCNHTVARHRSEAAPDP